MSEMLVVDRMAIRQPAAIITKSSVTVFRKNTFAASIQGLAPEHFNAALDDFRKQGTRFVKGITDKTNRLFAWRYLEYLSDASHGLNSRARPRPTNVSPASTLVRAELERLFHRCFRSAHWTIYG